MVEAGHSPWFDNINTKSTRETMDSLLRQTARHVMGHLGDPDKVMPVLSGGVTGRQFDPHTTDPIEPFLQGDPHCRYFSDNAIQAHAGHTLTLAP